jgi:gamma-glutamyl:cysteine ligase YbdK (ATP-grasp superfamily)
VSRGPSVWSRTGRLEARVQDTALRWELAARDVALREAAERVAAKHGLEPAEVLAEAQALVARAAAAGARTEAEVVAFLAREHGMTEDDLQAELAQVEAGW